MIKNIKIDAVPNLRVYTYTGEILIPLILDNNTDKWVIGKDVEKYTFSIDDLDYIEAVLELLNKVRS